MGMPQYKRSKEQELYPTVALSDIFNCAGHAYAAYVAFPVDRMSAYGLSYVALAAFAGVFRFGVSKQLFLAPNSGWAEAAGFVGLPLLGHRVVSQLARGTPFSLLSDEPAYISFLLLLYVAIRNYTEKNEKLKDLCRTIVAFLFFILPVCLSAAAASNWLLLGGCVTFLLGGVLIGPDRDRLLLGMRRENWFHYVICVAACMIGHGIKQQK